MDESENCYTPEFRFTRSLDATLARLTLKLKNKSIAVGNLMLTIMPVVFFLVVVHYLFPANYLLEFLSVFAGQATGLLMLVRIEKYRSIATCQSPLNNPV